jgi:anti-sigma regulatory factor (Ser/Thr protein kinase)
MDRLVPQRGPRDDVAVLALQNNPIPAILDLEFPADPAMLARLRRMLGRWLGEHAGNREASTEITIAVSEACANAIEHAYGPGRGTFRVRAERTNGSIEVTVADRGRWRPPRGEHRGRGLKIMEAAMDTCEVRFDDEGTEITMRRRVDQP